MAPIYRALARPALEHVGNGVLVETRKAFSPSEVDDLELWVIADLLGVHEPAASPAGVTEQQFREQAAALNAERIRRHQEGLPPPEPPPSATPEVTPDMIEALRQRRADREAMSGRAEG